MTRRLAWSAADATSHCDLDRSAPCSRGASFSGTHGDLLHRRHALRRRRTRAPPPRHVRLVEGHDEALIARWNAAVGPEDEVWHLGDFAAGASREHCAAVFARLNGRKRLVRGNHDTNRVLELPWADPPVESARITARNTSGRPWRLFLSHYPHRSWPGFWRETRHLYGHTHACLPDTSRSCDVGADACDYRPVDLAAIVKRQDAAGQAPEEMALRGLR